jgi:hypothetical protein
MSFKVLIPRVVAKRTQSLGALARRKNATSEASQKCILFLQSILLPPRAVPMPTPHPHEAPLDTVQATNFYKQRITLFGNVTCLLSLGFVVDLTFGATPAGQRRQRNMTRKREDELGDERLDQVTGGLVATTVEYPNLIVARKKAGVGSADTAGFMDYTDDDCMG